MGAGDLRVGRWRTSSLGLHHEKERQREEVLEVCGSLVVSPKRNTRRADLESRRMVLLFEDDGGVDSCHSRLPGM